MRRFLGNYARIATLGLLALAAGCAPESDMARDSENIRNVGVADFQAAVLKAGSPVAVDFYATWCGPCKRLAPVMEELAGVYKGKVVFVKVDIDRSPELAKQYEIEGVPTVIFFKDGKAGDRIVGFAGREVVKDKLDELVAAKPSS